MKNAGKRIHEARVRKGWTQSKLADLSGMPQATVSRIERGKIRNPSAEHIRILCLTLGIDPAYVFETPTIQLEGEHMPIRMRDLEEVKRRYRFAFENSHIGLMIVDLNGHNVMVNEIICSLFGYSQEEMEALSVHDTTHLEDLHVSSEFIQSCLSGEITSARFTKRHIHKDGHIIPMRVTSTLIRDPNNNPICFISRVEPLHFAPDVSDKNGIHRGGFRAAV